MHYIYYERKVIGYTVCATPPSRDHAAIASHFCSRVLVSADVFSPRSRLYIA